MTIRQTEFGNIDGKMVTLFMFDSPGVEVTITNYGCTLVSVSARDKNGTKANIIASYDTVMEYRQDPYYSGCVVGRYANRIASGTFVLDDVTYTLTRNDGQNHLHGGIHGFNTKIWELKHFFVDNDIAILTLQCTSEDGEEGYPGRVATSVTFTLNNDGELGIEYHATTSKPTPVNLTIHPYFNLTAFESAEIYSHELLVHSEWHTETNEQYIPTGRLFANHELRYDFRQFRNLGEQLTQFPEGYNDNFVVGRAGLELHEVAVLREHRSGRQVTVLSDLPGLQVYTANEWNGERKGQRGQPLQKYGAIALETQHYPDAPNHAHFPNPIITAESPFKSTTVYRFENF